MQPKFEPEGAGYNSTLLCPSCGNNYLHHERVETFARREDALEGVHVAVEGLKVTINTDLAGNPSSRRHGLIIYFSCETCDAKPVLTLAQHKGVTEVDLWFSMSVKKKLALAD